MLKDSVTCIWNQYGIKCGHLDPLQVTTLATAMPLIYQTKRTVATLLTDRQKRSQRFLLAEQGTITWGEASNLLIQ